MEKSCFITVHTLLNKPGNPVKESRVRINTIDAFGVCEDAMTQIGAAAYLLCPGGTCYTVESIEEIAALIREAEKG